MESPIYVFLHVCTLNDWADIVRNILRHVRESGLYDKAAAIYVTVLGTPESETDMAVFDDPKIEIVHRSENMAPHERRCLNALWEKCQTEDCRVLYMHSKGVSRRKGDHRFIKDWVECLLHFTVDRHADMLGKLEDFDAVGSHLHADRPHIFGGNFWWSKSSHIRRLHRNIRRRYGAPEMWVGETREPYRFWSPWRPHRLNHYFRPYPKELYVGKPFQNIIVEHPGK